MPHNTIARELAELGKSDMRLMSRLAVHSERLCEVTTALEANRARRCDLLCEAAKVATTAELIDPVVGGEVIEPKDK